MRLLREFHESGMSKYSFVRVHGLSCRALLDSWLRKYDSTEKELPLPEKNQEDMANRSKEDYKQENEALKKHVRDLEKALEFSKLETKARDMMIDKAEEYFNIPIRKKSGAK